MIAVTEWVDIINYTGYYQLNIGGSVKSLERTIIRNNGWPLNLPERILKHGLNKGYPSVTLSMNSKQKVHKIHRLLLTHFVGPCPVGMECCHKDDNPLNFAMTNIYWGTKSDNQQDRLRNGNSHNKRVMRLSDNKKFISIREASRLTRVDRKTLSWCLSGVYKTAGGEQWEYI